MPEYRTYKGYGPCSLIGTVQYEVPEHIQGEQLTSLSDLYSLGVTLYELLTQQLPFSEGRSNEVFFPQLFEKPVPPTKINKNIPKELELILLKLLEKDPGKRFQSAKELKDAFLRVFFPSNLQTNTIASKAINIVTPSKVKSFIEPEMVFIKGRTFKMGINNGRDNEKPVHSVTVSSFYIGKYTVTNKEYCLYNASNKNPGDNLPVVNVSWDDAIGYCKWLSSKTGKDYRLPTEAEWEYACRAGTTTEYYWGDEMDGSYCWYNYNSSSIVHAVGKKKPNAFNLYDMSGNVWEWCHSYNNYSSSEAIYIERGGSWYDFPNACRSSSRAMRASNLHTDYLGFRILMTIP